MGSRHGWLGLTPFLPLVFPVGQNRKTVEQFFIRLHLAVPVTSRVPLKHT